MWSLYHRGSFNMKPKSFQTLELFVLIIIYIIFYVKLVYLLFYFPLIFFTLWKKCIIDEQSYQNALVYTARIHNRTGGNGEPLCWYGSGGGAGVMMMVCPRRTAVDCSSAAAPWVNSGTCSAAAARCWWRSCRATDPRNPATPSKKRRRSSLCREQPPSFFQRLSFNHADV